MGFNDFFEMAYSCDNLFAKVLLLHIGSIVAICGPTTH